ncbi:MAG: hypothetical protein ACD_10C00222G0004 [uncultured bacterium]|nr:MAG: hypothetical protein ACD_10C00222G0004 [uncultured bacterium]
MDRRQGLRDTVAGTINVPIFSLRLEFAKLGVQLCPWEAILANTCLIPAV